MIELGESWLSLNAVTPIGLQIAAENRDGQAFPCPSAKPTLRSRDLLRLPKSRRFYRELRPRKKAVRSPATAAGSSTGAKCPPCGNTVQRWMLYARSTYERGGSPSGTVWCAKTPNAVGVPT